MCHDFHSLYTAAIKAAEYSHSPYSNFKVGAALLCKNQKIYTGCNIENISFSSTVCAERTAFYNAVSSGEKEFEAICIIGINRDESTDFTYPCGICRQVMSEFCPPDFKIIVPKSETEYKTYTLSELLPHSFNF